LLYTSVYSFNVVYDDVNSCAWLRGYRRPSVFGCGLALFYA